MYALFCTLQLSDTTTDPIALILKLLYRGTPCEGILGTRFLAILLITGN